MGFNLNGDDRGIDLGETRFLGFLISIWFQDRFVEEDGEREVERNRDEKVREVFGCEFQPNIILTVEKKSDIILFPNK